MTGTRTMHGGQGDAEVNIIMLLATFHELYIYKVCVATSLTKCGRITSYNTYYVLFIAIPSKFYISVATIGQPINGSSDVGLREFCRYNSTESEYYNISTNQYPVHCLTVISPPLNEHASYYNAFPKHLLLTLHLIWYQITMGWRELKWCCSTARSGRYAQILSHFRGCISH